MLLGGVPALEAGERRVVVVRPHVWVLVRAALPLPLLLLVPLPYTALDFAAPNLRLAALFPYVLWALVVAFVAYLIKWVLLDALPWTQRVYVLTSRRVIAQEGVLAVRRRECSLLKIEDSDYVSRGLMARLFDLGDVEVETAGRLGAIVLRDVPRPRRLQGLIAAEERALCEEESRRRQAEVPDRIARQLRTVMYGDGAAPTHVALTEPFRPISPRAARTQGRLNLLPDEAVVEVVRRHPVVLFVGLLAPLFAVLLVIAVTAVVGYTILPAAIAVVVLALSPWAVWRVLAYLQHEYVLTTERLMELRNTPLLFAMRDVVQLSSVQDIALEIPTVLGRLADTGDVVVELSGPAERVVLKTVRDPAGLQKLIFETIDARSRDQREREDQRLVSTLSRWFEEYHKLQSE